MLLKLFNLLIVLFVVDIHCIIPNGYEEVKNSHNFTGKVVLCTGSSSGIGKKVTKLFAYLGANVVVTGSNTEKVPKAAKEVEEVSVKKPLEVVADLTKLDDAKNLLDQTIKTYGKLDVLINNAGIHKGANIRDPNFMRVFDDTWNIDSSSKTAYNSAKAGIVMMSEVWAVELGEAGIRVNTISPGNILDVDIFGDAETTNKIMNDSDMPKQTPLEHRNGKPLDVATGYVFLASSDAKFITGVNLVIDGGYHFDSGAT